jgi:hypothetical protein
VRQRRPELEFWIVMGDDRSECRRLGWQSSPRWHAGEDHTGAAGMRDACASALVLRGKQSFQILVKFNFLSTCFTT